MIWQTMARQAPIPDKLLIKLRDKNFKSDISGKEVLEERCQKIPILVNGKSEAFRKAPPGKERQEVMTENALNRIMTETIGIDIFMNNIRY